MSDEHNIDGMPDSSGNPLEDQAAEYALGTLSADERQEADVRLTQDPAFADAVARWEIRLAPLLDAIPEQEAPEGVFFDIRQAIGGVSYEATTPPAATPATENIIRFDRAEQAMKRWRRIALASGALAASLLAFVLFREVYEPAQRSDVSFVAVLESEGREPAFVAVIDTRSGTVALRQVGATAEAGKSHQLWALGGGRTAPESLGVIDDGDINAAIDASRRDVLDGTIFAVSLEPEGGSPTGQPTGPVVFTGKLVPAPAPERSSLLERLTQGW